MVHTAKTPSEAQPARHRFSDPRSPHPSWRPTIAGVEHGVTRIANAGKFWARLGI